MNLSRLVAVASGLVAVAAAGIAFHALAAPAPSPFGSAESGVAFAVENGCLTWLREGGRVEDYVGRRARTMQEAGKPVQKIYGGGRVTVREDESSGCYVRAERGEGAKLRDTVINTLASAGMRTEAFADYAPHLKGRDWSFVQESHCFRMYGKVYVALISSSANRTRTPLQVTILPDTDGTAAKRGLCLS
ncbi:MULTISPECIES: hypothetical protein [Asticcacaulis]|uniref:hypothetical protein n=1 Tax=Asticcacaulis TaxID=76890 RepID=UPI001AE30581|nr:MULTISPECIES: hypothetical protein [Asticcacaulis]MBP2157536.1 hypothetical protein [Asticcacaulis solisilvae]MDR6798581.1 hypothetical protein [Asticcacaulis sp. BE141]